MFLPKAQNIGTLLVKRLSRRDRDVSPRVVFFLKCLENSAINFDARMIRTDFANSYQDWDDNYRTMEAGPSDYICLNCNLRFKNSRSFENHKRKFCQPQERISKAIITASRGYQESLNGQTEFPLKSATNGADFWSGKPTTSQSAFKSSGSYEVNFEFFNHS